MLAIVFDKNLKLSAHVDLENVATVSVSFL